MSTRHAWRRAPQRPRTTLVANPVRIEPLSPRHDRSRFSSGSDALDRYFREQASQDVKRRVTTCFVAVSVRDEDVAGYYTLTATGIALSGIAEVISKKLPRYPVVPAALLGRLAVERRYQGQGLGGILLADALMRAARAELGVFAMVVDAKDEAAQSFYEHYGFAILPGEGRRLCLPIVEALRRRLGEFKGL
jgi:GNAT superfamily N-acetyltransferase